MAALGYEVQVVMHSSGLSMKLMVEDVFLAGIVEGCNSISVIILFLSFILSFYGKASTTFLYILAGSAIIYSMNILRIVLLSVGLFEYPQYSGFLHSVFFSFGHLRHGVYLMDYLGQNLFEMEKERVSKNVRIILIICLVLMLAGVRLFEEHLFYDPFIRF